MKEKEEKEKKEKKKGESLVESIFHDEQVERVASPEQLDDYIHVTTPTLRIVLAAIIVFLFGVGIWACFGKIEVERPNGVEVCAPITYIING